MQFQIWSQTSAKQLPRQFYQLELRPPGGVVAFVKSICNAIIISNNITISIAFKYQVTSVKFTKQVLVSEWV